MNTNRDLIQKLFKVPLEALQGDSMSEIILNLDHPKQAALLEVCKRFTNQSVLQSGSAFTSSDMVYKYFRAEYVGSKKESFYTVLLDNKNKVITKCLISVGILNQSLVHPREVFVEAIKHSAASMILVHNHPSGVPTPSSQDINITRRLCEVGEIVGIQVLDHIIIGDSCHYSFVDRDIMPNIKQY